MTQLVASESHTPCPSLASPSPSSEK